ncbi:hypothetical protein L9F63_013185 [Diploptera punctata]|uniref:ABC transporter domain-containing protein n=1 Tax=Diploptera punctata TaxID=6984 RepID=A0AAD8EME7_DIPPU|nr:hypothetical protein L9F63_013185 [Diploptera punctata]
MQWKYVFRELDFTEDLTLGVVMLMLMFDIVLFIIIALYVDTVFPGKYGIPKPWNFLCKRSYWKSDYRPEQLQTEEVEDSENFEAEPTDLPNYGSQEVVKDMNLRLYDGQITVLLGHNGAGKTTTMSMVTGILKPSRGTIIVGGYDILANVEKVRLSMGLCPQHNVLFENLTAKDHLYFYGKLKGLKGDMLNYDVERYLYILQLSHVAKTKSKNLSGGQQRKLSVGVALCGNSKYVILDEPSSGMDPSARRQLWDLLEIEKRNRAIMLSTHFMDEADKLGDRIAIMHNGILECCGSPFSSRRNMFGAGYKLTIVKLPDCVTDTVTEALKRQIRDVKLIEDKRAEITYQLRDEDSGLFENLLSDLERNMATLRIESFGLSVTTMEEVFLKVGTPTSNHEEGNDEHKDSCYSSVKSSDCQHRVLLLLNVELVGRCTSWMYQVFALLMKRALYAWRSWITLILMLFLPSVVGLYDLYELSGSPALTFVYPPIIIDSKLYPHLITPIETQSMSPELKEIAEIYKRDLHAFVVKDITEHVLNTIDDDPLKVRSRYIMGASF